MCSSSIHKHKIKLIPRYPFKNQVYISAMVKVYFVDSDLDCINISVMHSGRFQMRYFLYHTGQTG